MDLAQKYSSRRNCQAGFQTVALTLWMPVFLMLMIALVVIANVVLSRTKTANLCFTASLQLQNGLRADLVQLLQLNPQAQKARTFRKISEANLQAASASGVPGWIAEAHAQRALAISQQMQIQFRQRKILQAAAERRLQFGQKLKAQMAALGASPKTLSVSRALAVQAVPPLDLSPDYVPLLGFESSQAQKTHYRFPIFQGAPSWITKNFSFLPEQSNQCGASLKGLGLAWSLTMTAANRSPN